MEVRSDHDVSFSADVFDYANASCSGSTVLRKHIPERRNGSFRASGTYKPPGSPSTVRFRVKGRFLSSNKVAGTLRASWSTATAQHGTLACDSGSIAWQAWDPAVGKHNGQLQPGRVYGGNTNQRAILSGFPFPIILKVSHDGRSVLHIASVMDNFCRDVHSDFKYVSGEFVDDKIPIRHDAFTKSDSFISPAGIGETAHYTEVLKGRFRRRVVSGTWRITAVITNTSGTQVDQCGGDTKYWKATDT